MEKQERLLLSPPTFAESDVEAVVAAIRSGWLAPAGPQIEVFEREVAEFVGVGHAVALSSGTAAIHLGLQTLGVQQGDCVIVPTVTFAATAFPVQYLGATPVFIDVDESGTVDATLLEEVILELRRDRHRVGAIVPVDLYGNPAKYAVIAEIASRYEVPILEDAAEALGSTYGDQPAGSFGDAAILSFNGNKIITSSGGGMFLSNDVEHAERVSHWSRQSRQPVPWYEHEEVGFNYRMSNILAALGSSQFHRIRDQVDKRRAIREAYRELFGGSSLIAVQDDPPEARSNAWLTVIQFSASLPKDTANRVREFLQRQNVESRNVWKPMHLQPVFRRSKAFLTGQAENFFDRGLCLPSGTTMSLESIQRVASLVEEAVRKIQGTPLAKSRNQER